jgi:hypothetical protein
VVYGVSPVGVPIKLCRLALCLNGGSLHASPRPLCGVPCAPGLGREDASHCEYIPSFLIQRYPHQQADLQTLNFLERHLKNLNREMSTMFNKNFG